jgi:hypothetical protein
MSFKFLRGEEKTLLLEPTQMLTLNRATFAPANVEFCFQFNDDEPINFGSGPNDLHIHVSPTPNGNIVFTNNDGQTFKIFARERDNTIREVTRRINGGHRA